MTLDNWSADWHRAKEDWQGQSSAYGSAQSKVIKEGIMPMLSA